MLSKNIGPPLAFSSLTPYTHQIHGVLSNTNNQFSDTLPPLQTPATNGTVPRLPAFLKPGRLQTQGFPPPNPSGSIIPQNTENSAKRCTYCFRFAMHRRRWGTQRFRALPRGPPWQHCPLNPFVARFLGRFLYAGQGKGPNLFTRLAPLATSPHPKPARGSPIITSLA